MKYKDSIRGSMAFIIGLLAIIIITVVIISTLGRSIPSVTSSPPPIETISPTPIETSTPQPTGNPYPPIESGSATPDFSATQTNAFLGTQKAISWATFSAVTRTPFNTPIIPPTGIYENERVKSSGEIAGLDAQNGWFGLIDGNIVEVWAGALLDDPDQGAVFILMTLPYRNFWEQILTPTRYGKVRVVSEQDNRLTLVADDGTTYYFDVPARRFVDSLTEVVSTATPPPTYTPYAPPAPETPLPTPNPYPQPIETGTAIP